MEVLTAILVIVTGVYVWLTHRILNDLPENLDVAIDLD
jgi:hypothetical protein